MNDPATSNPTVNEHAAAKILGFSASYLRQARMRNTGPAFVRVGRSIRYRVDDLRDFLEAHRVATKQQPASTAR
jgi:hypothetical protein